jgi:hypothetical protein
VNSVVAAWGRITAWIGAHAPISHGALRPPATLRQFSEAERALGTSLPPDLVTLWTLNNGAGSDTELEWAAGFGGCGPQGAHFLPHGQVLLPVQYAVDTYHRACDLGAHRWNARWLPFTALDPGAASGLFYDLTAGETFGRIGSFNFRGQDWPGRWPSLSVFLDRIATALERGRPMRLAYGGEDTERPGLDGGGLAWDEPECPLSETWVPYIPYTTGAV